MLPEGGRIRSMGGHMHDYAKEIRLEDVATGEVLVRLEARSGRDGSVEGMERTNFLLRRKGRRLSANRRYRIVAVYNNPTGSTIKGAMGLMVGAFTPDDLARWPVIDATDPMFQKELASLNGVQPTLAHATIRSAALVSPSAWPRPASLCASSARQLGTTTSW